MASFGCRSKRSPVSKVIAMWPSSSTKDSSFGKSHLKMDGSAEKTEAARVGVLTPTVRRMLAWVLGRSYRCQERMVRPIGPALQVMETIGPERRGEVGAGVRSARRAW
jgi:hypothetical protein